MHDITFSTFLTARIKYKRATAQKGNEQMSIVILTALGVGGATVVGAALGFLLRGIAEKFGDLILAFSAGVMLSASILGLVVPSLEFGGKFRIIITISSIFIGAVCIHLLEKIAPDIDRLARGEECDGGDKVMLLVLAIAIHNLPEGIAAGVGFGSGNVVDAISVAGGIALQNIPEGMVIIGPMLTSGIRPTRTFFIAFLTGLIEIVGTFIGYFSVSISVAVLPFALSIAAGAMIYIISDEIIPNTHSEDGNKGVTYSLLSGFCLMLVISELLS